MTTPRIAHSLSEFKRLKTQGADVVPPTFTVTEDAEDLRDATVLESLMANDALGELVPHVAAPRLSEAEVRERLVNADPVIWDRLGVAESVSHGVDILCAALFPPTEGQKP